MENIIDGIQPIPEKRETVLIKRGISQRDKVEVCATPISAQVDSFGIPVDGQKTQIAKPTSSIPIKFKPL